MHLAHGAAKPVKTVGKRTLIGALLLRFINVVLAISLDM